MGFSLRKLTLKKVLKGVAGAVPVLAPAIVATGAVSTKDALNSIEGAAKRGAAVYAGFATAGAASAAAAPAAGGGGGGIGGAFSGLFNSLKGAAKDVVNAETDRLKRAASGTIDAIAKDVTNIGRNVSRGGASTAAAVDQASPVAAASMGGGNSVVLLVLAALVLFLFLRRAK